MENEICVSLNISDFEDITHDEISTFLGVAPSMIHITGERMRPNHTRMAKRNVWFLHAPGYKTASVEEQVGALLDIIEPKLEQFKTICNKYYTEFSIALYMYVDTDESTPSLHLENRYHKIATELNAELDIDMILLAHS